VDLANFFRGSSKLRSSTFLAAPVGLKVDANGVSDHLKLLKGHYTGISFPITFKQDNGKNLTDILDTGFAGFFLISNRMKLILEENNLTGWQVFPIKLYDKKELEIYNYHGFSIVGHCGPIDYEKSEIIEKRMFPEGPLFKCYKGLYVGLDEWNGTDFFIPRTTVMMIMTKKAADILKKNKITNLSLEKLSEFEMIVDNIVHKHA
jgi:hypothetical protein